MGAKFCVMLITGYTTFLDSFSCCEEAYGQAGKSIKVFLTCGFVIGAVNRRR